MRAQRSSRAASGDVERRFVRNPIEIRAAADGGSIGFTGHAAVFDSRTWIGPPKWGFWETIHRGAFTKTIAESDVRMLFNHDPNFPLARNTITEGPGSLRLSEDEIGLRDDADMIPTTYARDLELSLSSGVVSQQSFSFTPVKEEWRTDEITGEDERHLYELRLYDVSPVTFPAFADTDASLRSLGLHMLMDSVDLDDERRASIIRAVRTGEVPAGFTPALRAAREALDALVQSAGEPEVPPLVAATPIATPARDRVGRSMENWRKLIEEMTT